jgi:hypothetical protein
MVSSKQSPIVHVQAERTYRTYPRYASASSFGYGDVMLLLTFCFALYGLFLYYFLPSATSLSYQRTMAELSYQWQVAWQSMRYSLHQASFSFSHTTVLGEWYQYLTTLVMS